MPHIQALHIASLHFAIVDFAIIAVFILQVFWGAKLGFASATFALAGEIIGLILGLLYADAIAKSLDNTIHINILIARFISDRVHVDPESLRGVSQTISDAIVFFGLFVGIQMAFLWIGRIIHHQVGVRRMKILSNSFFGMFVGAMKASLEVIFFLIIWTALVANPTVSGAIHSTGADHLTNGSVLLPIFMRLVPPTSPISKLI